MKIPIITIEPLVNTTNFQTIVKVIKDSFREYSTSDVYFSILDQNDNEILKKLRLTNRILIGAKADSKLCGFCSVVFPSNIEYNKLLSQKNVALLELFCVLPEYRRYGVGANLMNQALFSARSLSGCEFLRWDCSAKAKASVSFYKSMHADNIASVNYGMPFGDFLIFSLNI